VYISIIIPVLNEELMIGRTLQNILNILNIQTTSSTLCQICQIIVVDGGSHDRTLEIVKSFPVEVVETTGGRAVQMNEGAKIATGEILLFLHGDTLLPTDFADWVTKIMNTPGAIAGAFRLKVNGSQPLLRLIEILVNVRSHYGQLPYGDQAIFLRAETFRQIGGFPLMPIMEDFVLIRQLGKMGKIAIAPVAVITSERRWQKLGICQTTLINQLIIIGYWCGVSPAKLAKWYRKQRG
jgi:rSAM/selenodomain-associated transferase 2